MRAPQEFHTQSRPRLDNLAQAVQEGSMPYSLRPCPLNAQVARAHAHLRIALGVQLRCFAHLVTMTFDGQRHRRRSTDVRLGLTAMFRCAAAVSALMAIGTVLARALEVNGIATTVDADTLDVDGGSRVRLFGIDAPEIGQQCRRPDGTGRACGAVARDRLAGLVDGKAVLCVGDAVDDYKRLLAHCSVGGVEVNALLVSEGLAWAFVKYHSSYINQEAIARAAHRGSGMGLPSPRGVSREAVGDGRSDRAARLSNKGNINRDG